MFSASLIMSILIINNKLNGVPISQEFYNFAIFCIAVDVLVLLSMFNLLYKGNRSAFVYGWLLISILGITVSSILVTLNKGNQITNDLYMLAISYVAIYALLVMYTSGSDIMKMFSAVFRTPNNRISPF